MKIYNQEKTQILENPDLSAGRLQKDKILVQAHAAVAAKSAEEYAAELQAQGATVETINGKLYEIVQVFPNGGRSVREIKATPAQEAWNEYEDIQVYIPYTAEELQAQTLSKIRGRRAAECFPIVNRGVLWYEKLTEAQRQELSEWYEAWLDAPETGIVPDAPVWLNTVARQG